MYVEAERENDLIWFVYLKALILAFSSIFWLQNSPASITNSKGYVAVVVKNY